MEHINFKKLETQSYLKSYAFKTDEKQLLFKLRTRMTNVKCNFKTMYTNTDCNLCLEGKPQTDIHLLDCKKILENCPKLAHNYEAEYEDIFGDCEKQLRIAKLFKEVFDVKSSLEDQIS